MATQKLTPVDVVEQSAPANPAAGFLRVYAGTDHALHTLSSGGVNTALGAGGGGGASEALFYMGGM